MKKSNQPQTRKKGFTLIELSIVLVIIGLIVGGVLVGQDLIKAAEIRATVSQLEKYAAAVNTFRGKYNGLPGDLTNGATFGLVSTTATTGIGNGLIESNGSAGLGRSYCGETQIFWRHMAQANLISESITEPSGAGTAATYECLGYTVNDSTIPLAKMGKGNRLFAVSTGGLNYFMMAGAATVANTGIPGTIASTLTPIEAFQIDGKLDDGLPTTGLVASSALMDPSTIQGGAGTATTACYDTTTATAQVYAIAENTSTPACQLRIRSSF